MNEMENHQQAINAVDSIVYEGEFYALFLFQNHFSGRGTNTGAAIKWVVENAFRPEFGDRPEVPNKVNTHPKTTCFQFFLRSSSSPTAEPEIHQCSRSSLAASRSSPPSTLSVSANRSTTSSSTESLPIRPSVTCSTSTTSASSSEPSKSPLCLAFSATKSASNNFCPDSIFLVVRLQSSNQTFKV